MIDWKLIPEEDIDRQVDTPELCLVVDYPLRAEKSEYTMSMIAAETILMSIPAGTRRLRFRQDGSCIGVSHNNTAKVLERPAKVLGRPAKGTERPTQARYTPHLKKYLDDGYKLVEIVTDKHDKGIDVTYRLAREKDPKVHDIDIEFVVEAGEDA